MNNDQILSDFRRRYDQSYVWLHMEREQREVLARVNGIESSTQKVGVIRFETQEYGTLVVNLGSEGHSMRFRYPKSGVFQHGDMAAAFYRLPRRQYRRGLCGDNSSMLLTTRNLGAGGIRYDFSSLKSAFDHKTYSVEEALSLVGQGKMRSVALDDNLSVSLPLWETSDDQLLVLHYLTPIALVNSKGKVTRVIENVYKDLLKRYFDV